MGSYKQKQHTPWVCHSTKGVILEGYLLIIWQILTFTWHQGKIFIHLKKDSEKAWVDNCGAYLKDDEISGDTVLLHRYIIMYMKPTLVGWFSTNNNLD